MDNGPEQRENRVNPISAIDIFKDNELQLVRDAAESVQGVRVEILPKETPEDKEVAAQAFMLQFELAGKGPKSVFTYDKARAAMADGQTLVRITTNALPGEKQPNESRFRQALEDIKKSRH